MHNETEAEIFIEENIKSWLSKNTNYKTKHYKKLDICNSVVQAIIKNNANTDSEIIIQKLKLFYWKKCDNIEQFEEIIKHQLKNNCFNLEKL